MSTSQENRYIWLNGAVLPLSDAKINVLSPTAQYGLNVFEGIRCYWNEEHGQLYAFRLADHHKRLRDSMKMLRIEGAYSEEALRQSFFDVISANGYREDIAVRQTVFVDGFGSWSATAPTGMFIAPIPKGRTTVDGKWGVHCCVSSWERISDRSMSPRVKTGANYINSRMAQLEAAENGYDSAIFLNSQGRVAEGVGSCLFIVRDGALITPPCTASILESITRLTLVKLAKHLGLAVIERDIVRTELYTCDEIFLCGSSVEVMPVLSVDRHMVGNGRMGEVTGRMLETYLKTVTGEYDDHRHWLTRVYETTDRVE